jgi:hypothetical protein
MLDFTNIIGAQLNFDFDFNKINDEILSLKSLWKESPISKYWLKKAQSGEVFMSESVSMYDNVTHRYRDGEEIKKAIGNYPSFYNLYLRSHGPEEKFNFENFGVTKYLDHENWIWRDSIKNKISYTMSCIESLPYKTIGLVRVLITEKTFLPTHIDCEAGDLVKDLGKTLGISLISDTGGVPLKIWSKKDNCIKDLWSNSIIFKDSEAHAVPFTDGRRITIRIFGDIDFDRLSPMIDKDTILL